MEDFSMKNLRRIYSRASLYGLLFPIFIWVFALVVVLPNHIGIWRYFAMMLLMGVMLGPSFAGVANVVIGQYRNLEIIRLRKLYRENNITDDQFKNDVVKVISEKLDYFESDADKKEFMVITMAQLEMVYRYPVEARKAKKLAKKKNAK